MSNVYIGTALVALVPNASFELLGGKEYEHISWHETNSVPLPSKADVEAKQKEIADNEVANQYQRDRVSAYPSIQEQLDMQYWDSINGTTTWADAIAKVKADYPKGAE
jgi:hypothetical protein